MGQILRQQVVCGGPLTPYVLHNPSSSFDVNNRFVGGALLDAAMEPPVAVTIEPQEAPPSEPLSETQSPQAESVGSALAQSVSHEVSRANVSVFIKIVFKNNMFSSEYVLCALDNKEQRDAQNNSYVIYFVSGLV